MQNGQSSCDMFDLKVNVKMLHAQGCSAAHHLSSIKVRVVLQVIKTCPVSLPRADHVTDQP